MLLWLVCVLVLLLGLYTRYPYFLQDALHVFWRLHARRRVTKYAQANLTILDIFLQRARTQPHRAFIRFEDRTWTYREVDRVSNQAARAFRQCGVEEGETVALFLGNEPAFLYLWLGLVKVGCAAAFLNYNIRSKSLLHCLQCSGASRLVAAAELQDAVAEILPDLLEQNISVLVLTDVCTQANMTSFKDKMSQASSEAVPKEARSRLTVLSPATYIYTSGTTGLPKAAVVSHLRIWIVSFYLSILGVRSSDVMYLCLPLYHTAAFMAFTASIERGMTIVLRRKFSTSQFWDDCRKYDVTVIQYIGEVMRYLCNTPKKSNDRNHSVRIAIGNGMRADVWREFLNRFGNIRVFEFYGATEGNMALWNYTNKIGAVGRDTIFQRWVMPYALIKYDTDAGEPVRDSAGYCIRAEKDEPGLLVCEITQKTPFVGYARDLKQTEKKRLHNVFKQGDTFFNSGDLLSVDSDNFVYFVDRTGDTFRWKGENVATNEVSDVLTTAECIKEANVYGVSVSGQEGRVGMAAITLKDGQDFDTRNVFKHVQSLLPTYARPRFIRIKNTLEVTGTFKNLKVKLVEEGFDPSNIAEPLFFLDEDAKTYVPLTQEIHREVQSGNLRL